MPVCGQAGPPSTVLGSPACSAARRAASLCSSFSSVFVSAMVLKSVSAVCSWIAFSGASCFSHRDSRMEPVPTGLEPQSPRDWGSQLSFFFHPSLGGECVYSPAGSPNPVHHSPHPSDSATLLRAPPFHPSPVHGRGCLSLHPAKPRPPGRPPPTFGPWRTVRNLCPTPHIPSAVF